MEVVLECGKLTKLVPQAMQPTHGTGGPMGTPDGPRPARCIPYLIGYVGPTRALPTTPPPCITLQRIATLNQLTIAALR